MTVVVRPEHAALRAEPGERTACRRRSTNVVYFGTDTHYPRAARTAATPFIVRQQNSRGGAAAFERGDRVGIALRATTPPRS